MRPMAPFALFFSAAALGGGPPVGDTELRVLGVAQDAKGRALLQAEDGVVWTVLGLDAWPAGVSGQRVAVVGAPGRAHTVPVATQGPDGAWSQGVAPGSAPDRTLGGSRWSRLPPETGAWTVEVRLGDQHWVVSGEGAAAPGGVSAGGVRRLFHAVGVAQASQEVAGPGAAALELRTSGAAGEGGARLAADAPAARDMVATMATLGAD